MRRPAGMVSSSIARTSFSGLYAKRTSRMEIAGGVVISTLLRVGTNCVAVHDEGDIAVRTVYGGDVKPARNNDWLSERHLRFLIALQLDVDHLIRGWWRHVDAGSGERNEDKLCDLVGVVFKGNHKTRDGDELVIQSSSGRA